MLRLLPDKRAKASDLVHHNWLEGVLVQGEIDVIRRAEMDDEEASKRMRRQQQPGSNRESSRLLNQSERDAMKPVDESVICVNGQEEEEEEEEPEGEEEGDSKRPKHQTPLLAAPPAPTSTGIMASGITRALQSNANVTPLKQVSESRAAGSKSRI